MTKAPKNLEEVIKALKLNLESKGDVYLVETLLILAEELQELGESLASLSDEFRGYEM